jgi:hypothetical protein
VHGDSFEKRSLLHAALVLFVCKWWWRALCHVVPRACKWWRALCHVGAFCKNTRSTTCTNVGPSRCMIAVTLHDIHHVA